MPKKRKPTARDNKKDAISALRPKIEMSLRDKLKAAGIIEAVATREDRAADRIDRDSHDGRDSESEPNKQQTDRDELNRAYLGVKRLGNQSKRRVRERETAVEGDAISRLQPGDGLSGPLEVDRLATPGFEINWDRDGDVSAHRRDVEIEELSSLFGVRFKPEAILDLHGTFPKDLERKVVRFVRDQYRRGIRRLLIVHGKGKHSQDGVGVLADYLVDVLTQSRVSYYVQGFCTANLEQGGSGALAVMLIS